MTFYGRVRSWTFFSLQFISVLGVVCQKRITWRNENLHLPQSHVGAKLTNTKTRSRFVFCYGHYFTLDWEASPMLFEQNYYIFGMKLNLVFRINK